MKTFIYLVSGLILIIGIAVGIYFFKSFLDNTQKQITFRETKQYIVDPNKENQIDVQATTLPQFVVKLADEKFKNLWTAHAAERENKVEASMINEKGDTGLKVTSEFDTEQKQIVLTPENKNQFKPGLYKLNLKVKTYNGQNITITQDFTWGVLAMNFGKAIYKPGQTVKIGMGVLDDFGNTKCIATGDVTFDTAKVWLTIKTPSGKIQTLSTDDQSIIGSKECAPTSITNNPDFQAQFAATEIGKYYVHMEAENINGKKSIDDLFVVQGESPKFDIMRTSYPTRIYPFGHYPVEITVVANQDYSGIVSDFVPENFRISNLSGNGIANKHSDYQELDWQVNWRAGQTYKLNYDIQFPLISPEFYLVGPLKIGDPSASSGQVFSEGRSWQIASDVISQTQTPVSNVVNSGTTVSGTLGSALTANTLSIVICSETGSAIISSPARGSGNSWTSAFSVTSTPRIRLYWRISKATDATTLTCTFNSSTGVKAIQIFEYSGLATASVRDQVKTRSGSSSCNTSPFQFTSNTTTFTITNPVELVIASFVATTARTVNSHTAGYTQQFAFNGSSGTFTTAYQYTNAIADYTDTVTFSGSAGTCSSGIVSFITPLNQTQNGFRFFYNIDDITPATAFDTQNTNITLPFPHYPFRVRMLVDIDGNQTMGLSSASYILQYAALPAGSTCSAIADVTWASVSTIASGSEIAYNPNTSSGGSGVNIISSGIDPTDAGYTTILQSYYEDNGTDITNAQNSLAGNQAGLWDFSLLDNSPDLQSTTYCLRLVNSDGAGSFLSGFDSYIRYPQVSTYYNEVNIRGPGNATGTTVIKGSPGKTIIN